MKPDQNYSKRIKFKLRSLEVNQYRGNATLSPIIYVTTLDFNIGINDRNSFQIKAPFQYVTGNLGDVSGVGDISLSVTRNLFSKERYSINATIGTKIPTGDSDKDKAGRDYPMYYQPSLGSYDIIFGGSWISSEWLVAVGYQQALNKNNNEFQAEQWFNDELYPDLNYLLEHDEGVHLLRGTDLMLRTERNWRYANFNLNLGLLTIYRITKDEALNTETGRREEIDGTIGPAITLLGGGGYNFNVNSSLKLILGLKLKQRDVNPDQLTRDDVVSISYVFRF